jgi:hypothetical protein
VNHTLFRCFSASKGGDSPFAVPLRPGSASQSLGQPFSIRSEPVLPHHLAPSSRCPSPSSRCHAPLHSRANAQSRGECAAGRGIEFSNRQPNLPHHIRHSPRILVRGLTFGEGERHRPVVKRLLQEDGCHCGVGGWDRGGSDWSIRL